MNLLKLNISQVAKLTFFMLVLSFTSIHNIFNEQGKLDFTIAYNNNSSIAKSSQTLEQKGNANLLYQYLINPINNDHKLNSYLCELEEEEEESFSNSKKVLKINNQKSFSLHRLMHYIGLGRITIHCFTNTLSKTPLYILYQVHRI
jgi:hypothetical protein